MHHLGYVGIHQVLHTHSLTIHDVLFVHVEPGTLTQVPSRGSSAGLPDVTRQETLDCALVYASIAHSHDYFVVTHTVNKLLPHRAGSRGASIVDAVNHFLGDTLNNLRLHRRIHVTQCLTEQVPVVIQRAAIRNTLAHLVVAVLAREVVV